MSDYPSDSLGAKREEMQQKMDSLLADMRSTTGGRLTAWWVEKRWKRQQDALDTKLAAHRQRILRETMGYDLSSD